MHSQTHLRLVTYATQLKKSWLLAAIWRGCYTSIEESSRSVPNYAYWHDKDLRKQIDDLEDDLADQARKLFNGWRTSSLGSTAKWLSERYDEWAVANRPIYCICRVIDVERAIGPLEIRGEVECPPYAEVLAQGVNNSFAIRHPEYHLARDVALLDSLFADAEANLDSRIASGKLGHSEINQSLGRSVFLACYSLLDSFVSGIAAAWLLEHPNLPPDVVKTLSKSTGSLETRFVNVLAIIIGHPDPIADARADFDLLFGEFVKRRNAFVHCEPDVALSKSAIEKEQRFHDINPKVVSEVVRLTIAVIRAAWFKVHGSTGPRWLPKRGPDGRYDRVDVRLYQTDREESSAKK